MDSTKTKQQYQLTVSPQRFFQVYKIDYLKDNDLQLYQYRIDNPHPYHPRVLKIQNKTLYYSVVIEHTPYRLQDIHGSLFSKTQKPVVNLIAQTIIGFQSLYKKFGAFKIKNTLIGFDKKWVVKVWLNNNFAKNHLNPFDHMASDCQESMIKNILTVFEGHEFEDEELRGASTFKMAMRVLVGKVGDEVKNELVNALSEKPREKQKQKEKEKVKQKEKQKEKDKNEYDIPTTPKHKPKQQNSTFYDKTRHRPQQYIPDHTTTDKPLQLKIPKIPKISQETTTPPSLPSDKKPLPSKLSPYQPVSSKDLHSNHQQPSHQESMSDDDFLIIRREIEVPEFTDEANVKQFLGCGINSYQAKIKLIGFVMASQAGWKVKELAGIFEYALTKDPDLYKNLLMERGNILGLSESDKAKVNNIRKMKQMSPSSYPKFAKTPVTEKEQSKKKQSHDNYYTTASKMSQDFEDSARKNSHMAHHTELGQSLIQSHRPIGKAFTMKQTNYRPHNPINNDWIEIPARTPTPFDEFASSHSEIPMRSDIKQIQNTKQQIPQPQPRSHQKSSQENSRKPFIPQITVTKNPNKETTNFRDQVLKYVVKE